MKAGGKMRSAIKKKWRRKDCGEKKGKKNRERCNCLEDRGKIR